MSKKLSRMFAAMAAALLLAVSPFSITAFADYEDDYGYEAEETYETSETAEKSGPNILVCIVIGVVAGGVYFICMRHGYVHNGEDSAYDYEGNSKVTISYSNDELIDVKHEVRKINQNNNNNGKK